MKMNNPALASLANPNCTMCQGTGEYNNRICDCVEDTLSEDTFLFEKEYEEDHDLNYKDGWKEYS
jgi:hypothetical protein